MAEKHFPKTKPTLSRSRSSRKTNIEGIPAAFGTGTTDHSQSGDTDVVQERYNQTQLGKALHTQLKKNKSTGISGWR